MYLSQKIKNVIKKRPSKEEIENSEWTACCKGPILKKELEENMWVCPYCNKRRLSSTYQLWEHICKVHPEKNDIMFDNKENQINQINQINQKNQINPKSIKNNIIN